MSESLNKMHSRLHFYSLTKFKMTGDRYLFKFLQRGVDGKHLMHFQSESTLFEFLWRTVWTENN